MLIASDITMFWFGYHCFRVILASWRMAHTYEGLLTAEDSWLGPTRGDAS